MINFADKEEMELKSKVILSEVTQTQKTKPHMYPHVCDS